MENVHVVGVISPEIQKALADSRHTFIRGLDTVDNMLKGYASNLSMAFDVTDPTTGKPVTKWYALKGKARAGVKAERALFVSEMEEAGYSKGTIDVYWQRVKEASGYVTAGNRVSGSNDIDTVTRKELQTIINRIFKAEETGQDFKASEVKGTLIEAFELLGGEVDKLG